MTHSYLTPAFTVTPATVRRLLEEGFNVNVERSPVRIFEDKEFEDVGATMVSTGSWPNAPQDHIIIGLKELPEEECTLSSHILPKLSLTRFVDSSPETYTYPVCALLQGSRWMGQGTVALPRGWWNVIRPRIPRGSQWQEGSGIRYDTTCTPK